MLGGTTNPFYIGRFTSVLKKGAPEYNFSIPVLGQGLIHKKWIWVQALIILLLAGVTVQAQDQPRATLQEISFAKRADGRGYVVRLGVNQRLSASQVRINRSEGMVEMMLYNTQLSDTLRREPATGPVSDYTVEQRLWTTVIHFTLVPALKVQLRAYPDRASNDYLVALNYRGIPPSERPAVAEEDAEEEDTDETEEADRVEEVEPAPITEPPAEAEEVSDEPAPEVEEPEPTPPQPEEMQPEEEVQPALEPAPAPPQTEPQVDTKPAPTSARPARTPDQRQVRTYIPPNQIVSFLPNTSFDQFVAGLNPIFQEVTGREIVDVEGRDFPIDVSIVGMQFFDAFEMVLELHELWYRETDQYFVVEEAPAPNIMAESISGSSSKIETSGTPNVDINSREIKIEAILFDVNLTKARQLGLDWSVFLGGESSGGGGGSSNVGSGGESQGTKFFVKVEDLFEPLGDRIIAPKIIEAGELSSFFQIMESNGVGQTVASPTITVRSGVEGSIQIGSDIPVQVRDFAGNTITQFQQTGIIVRVTPTLMTNALADTLGAPTLDFIHLKVRVERSNGRFFAGALSIDRTQANTEVLLLDDEMTIIGGLFSTDETASRTGIPILKDLPPWFFGLRYIFGIDQKTTTQRELMIVLRAKVLDPLVVRAQRGYEKEMRERYRRDMLRNLERFDKNVKERVPTKPPKM